MHAAERISAHHVDVGFSIDQCLTTPELPGEGRCQQGRTQRTGAVENESYRGAVAYASTCHAHSPLPQLRHDEAKFLMESISADKKGGTAAGMDEAFLSPPKVLLMQGMSRHPNGTQDVFTSRYTMTLLITIRMGA